MALIIMLLTMVATAIVGVTIEKLAYKPLRNSSKLTVLITAIGVSLFLQYTGQLVFGAAPRSFPIIIENVSFNILGATIGSNRSVVFVVTLLLMFALRIIVMNTKMGAAIRAVSNTLLLPSLMGINISNVISFTFVIGSSLAALRNFVQYKLSKHRSLNGNASGSESFYSSSSRGIGNFPGAFVGGLIIGLVETFTVGYLSPTYRDAIAFAILILILLVKPTGLFGKKDVEKV